jgi:hypothetical protein
VKRKQQRRHVRAEAYAEANAPKNSWDYWPAKQVYEVMQKTRSLYAAAQQVPASQAPRRGSHSDALRAILRGSSSALGVNGSSGLGGVAAILRRLDLELLQQLTADERKVVKAKIAECMELLDEMDRRCK